MAGEAKTSTTTMVFAGLGTITAIAVIYFGFTEKGKNKWASLMGPKGTDSNGNSLPRTAQTADDAKDAVMKGADGSDAIPKRSGVGSPFGSNGADGTNTSVRYTFPFASTVKVKKDAPNRKLDELKKQGLVTF